MAEEQRNAGAQSPVRHEPIVSETLKDGGQAPRDAAAGDAGSPSDARQAPLDEGAGSPSKRHGDALETGTGTRHGMRPNQGRPEGTG